MVYYRHVVWVYVYVYCRLYVMYHVIYNVYYDVYYCGFMFRLFDGIVWVYCVMLIWFYSVFGDVCMVWPGGIFGCVRVLCLVVPDGFIPDFIVIDVIYYFLIAYNVWLYIYVFRRILLFLYVVECRFYLVFIGFMLFMVLWSYFLFMQNFTIVHGRMYWRTKIPHRGIFYINCI